RNPQPVPFHRPGGGAQPRTGGAPVGGRDRAGSDRTGRRRAGRDDGVPSIGARMNLDPHIPAGPLESKWDTYRRTMKLVSPASRRKLDVLVVGSGLAGASAAASLAEL